MAKFEGDLKLVHGISIVEPTLVYRGADIQDFINLTYDYQSIKNFISQTIFNIGAVCL